MSGSLLPSIGLGTAQYGSQLNEEISFALLDRFVEHGGTFLDTAHIYGAWDASGANGGCGNSETIIGRWMKARGTRNQVLIGTKGGHPNFTTKASGLTQNGVMQHLQESLGHLQTDVIDLYWLHRDDRSIPVEEILSWLKEPLEQGRIRSVGVSHWRSDRLAEARAVASRLGLPPIQASQIAWSLARPAETITDGPFGEQLAMDAETFSFHCASQLPLVAYNTQAMGFFAEKYNGFDLLSPGFPNGGIAHQFGSILNVKNRQVAQELAKKKGCSTNQIALAWLLHQPFSTTVIVGPRTEEQLDDSMAATAVSLSEEERGWGEFEILNIE